MCVCLCMYVRRPAAGPTQAITPKFGVGSSFHPGLKPSQGRPQMLTPGPTHSLAHFCSLVPQINLHGTISQLYCEIVPGSTMQPMLVANIFKQLECFKEPNCKNYFWTNLFYRVLLTTFQNFVSCNFSLAFISTIGPRKKFLERTKSFLSLHSFCKIMVKRKYIYNVLTFPLGTIVVYS